LTFLRPFSFFAAYRYGAARFSSQRIETMLGFKPEWNIEKALPEMVREMRSAQRITRRTDEG